MLCQLACWFELARHSNTGHSDVQAPHTDALTLDTVPQGATLGFRTTVDGLCWFPQRYSGITALEQARQIEHNCGSLVPHIGILLQYQVSDAFRQEQQRIFN